MATERTDESESLKALIKGLTALLSPSSPKALVATERTDESESLKALIKGLTALLSPSSPKALTVFARTFPFWLLSLQIYQLNGK